MEALKLTKLEDAKNIIGEEFKDFQWKVKELPLHQCLGRYLSQEIILDKESFRMGDGCLKKGQYIGPIEVRLLATLGKVVVPVFEKPIVSIISSGDELVSIIEEPITGKVRDSNSFALAALVQETGCDVGGVYLLGDDKNILKEKLQEALDSSDLIIVSGGSSPLGEGVTAAAIKELGSPGVVVNGIDLKYAETTALGIIEDTHCACCNRKSLIAGLPGEPDGVFVSYKSLIDGLIKEIFFS